MALCPPPLPPSGPPSSAELFSKPTGSQGVVLCLRFDSAHSSLAGRQLQECGGWSSGAPQVTLDAFWKEQHGSGEPSRPRNNEGLVLKVRLAPLGALAGRFLCCGATAPVGRLRLLHPLFSSPSAPTIEAEAGGKEKVVHQHLVLFFFFLCSSTAPLLWNICQVSILTLAATISSFHRRHSQEERNPRPSSNKQAKPQSPSENRKYSKRRDVEQRRGKTEKKPLKRTSGRDPVVASHYLRLRDGSLLNENHIYIIAIQVQLRWACGLIEWRKVHSTKP